MDFTVEVEPRSVFQMKGLGYYHPQRGQGRDHGRESVLREQWRIADLDPIARENVHAQQLSVVRPSDGIEGIGIFEHIAMGRTSRRRFPMAWRLPRIADHRTIVSTNRTRTPGSVRRRSAKDCLASQNSTRKVGLVGLAWHPRM